MLLIVENKSSSSSPSSSLEDVDVERDQLLLLMQMYVDAFFVSFSDHVDYFFSC